MTDDRDHVLKLADADDSVFAKWLRANRTRLAQIAFDWSFWRRPDQAEPAGDWRCWLLLAGRGFGKTRTGAEWVRARAEADGRLRIALVAATMADARAIMVEGESGLLSIAPEDMRPSYEPSLHRLVWPNGAMAKLYSAAEPEGLRGPEHHIAWADECAKWDNADAVWDNMAMSLRLGTHPQVMATNTPRPVPLIRRLMAEAGVHTTRGRMVDNALNLAAPFVAAMQSVYAGTRLGRQELDGELIDDVDGALWTRAMMDMARTSAVPQLARTIIGVDPPAGRKGDACGIVAAALGADGLAYILDDASLSGASPEGWARQVAACAAKHGADRVIAEANNGGDMVESVLRGAAPTLPVRLVHAARGKVARAEPVALAPLNDIAALDWTDRGTALHVGRPDFPIIVVAEEDLGAAIDLKGSPRLHQKLGAADSLPSRVELGFADPSRDYQPGLQSIDLHANGQVQHVDLPAALATDKAAHWARERLFAARRETMTVEVRLPWRYLSGWSAASLSMQGQPWRVRSVVMEGMSVVVTLSPRTALPPTIVPVDGGRIVAAEDRAAGQTLLHLADLPSVQDAAASAPLVVAAAAGTTPGWRSAVLMQRAGPTAPWEDLGRKAAPATMGTARNPLGTASPHLMDVRNTLMVEVLHDGMSLLSVADDALWTGANFALVGGEILQFGLAERIAPGRWALSRLLRGRRGTESRITDHAAQEPFLLLDPDTLAALSVPTGANSIDVMAKGVGDADGVIASLSTISAALRPLSPVHLRLASLPDGGVAVQWTRRSREGWRWLDGIDVPVAEEAELYRIEIVARPLAESIGATLAQPHYHLSAGQLAELRATGATSLTLSVRQVGRFAPSDPATKAFPI